MNTQMLVDTARALVAADKGLLAEDFDPTPDRLNCSNGS